MNLIIRGGLAAAVLLLAGNALADPLRELAKPKEYTAQRASSADPNWQNGNADFRAIPAGGTITLADLRGPGEITHIWCTVAARDRNYSRLLVVRIYWDGETHPSVEAPLGDFFGVGHGIDAPYDSFPIKVSSEGRARNCFWNMPFRRSARITITNDGGQDAPMFYWYVNWRKLKSLPANTPYFHAMYRQEHPTVMGRNYVIAEIEGRGHYVGTLLNVRQLSPGWWGEGDDLFFIDGEKEPSIRGTGAEDYFCDAWGMRRQSGLFYGAPVFEGDTYGARTSMYRWHVTDPIPFTRSLRFEIEHKGQVFNEDGSVKSGFGERRDNYSSVAFWYQVEPSKPFPPLPKAQDRLYFDYSQLTEAEALIEKMTLSEGAISRQDLNGWSGGAHAWWRPNGPNQTLSFQVQIPADGTYQMLGLLTRSFDYGVYQLEINGQPVGPAVDLYAGSVAPFEVQFPPIRLSKGTHTITFRSRDKNPASAGFMFGFDAFLFAKQP